jgi:hypothetical protein
MKPIVTFPKGSLTAKDKKELCSEGYIPLETNEGVTVVMPSVGPLSADDLGLCAIRALADANSDWTKAQFFKHVANAIEAKKAQPTPSK